jgi:lipoprotein LpqB-like beta-propeller protein/sporulation and spore germination protein
MRPRPAPTATPTRRRPVVLLVALVAALALDLAASGCVSLPRSGSVHSSGVVDAAESDTLVDYTPPGPTPKVDRMPLVEGFLTAMTATPLTTYVARQFLTAASSRSWAPQRGTVVYDTEQLVSTRKGVEVRLRGVVELDGRGSWLGDPTSGRGHDYRLHVVKERGQWRIANPPDRLLVPRTDFDSEYQQGLLYFFDQAAQVLVPEPVYVPRGRQTPTLLVTALLKGPEPALRDVERTFVPAGARLDGISVPVSGTGTVEVPLSPDVLDLGSRRLEMLFAQLAWTLKQVPGVRRLRVTVAGTPVDLAGGREDLPVDAWSRYDPAVAYASTDMFGLRDGRVVSVGEGHERRVSGPFGVLRLGLRSIAVDLLAQRVAGVSADGRRALEAARDGVPGRTPTLDDVRTLYRGDDLLRPSYDLYGQVWLVDRTAAGAQLSVVRAGRARRVTAPGISGADVLGFVLSRDGTRLVAQVRRDGHQHLVVARVRRDGQGQVEGLTPARTLPVAGAPGPLRDVAWRTPASLAVLVRPSGSTSQVLVVTVDGSVTAPLSSDLEPLRVRGRRVIAAPVPATHLWVQATGTGGHPGGRLIGFSRRGEWQPSSIDPGLVSPVFVG